jgi:hypothetical protein
MRWCTVSRRTPRLPASCREGVDAGWVRAVQAHGLTKRFGAVQAVAGWISRCPLVLGLLVPNGAGKTYRRTTAT